MATFGIDFDKTYTADPELFSMFISNALMRGHKVVIVTAKDASSSWKVDAVLTPKVPVVYAGLFRWKEEAAREAGFEVDVWMDDNPEFIKEMDEHERVFMR